MHLYVDITSITGNFAIIPAAIVNLNFQYALSFHDFKVHLFLFFQFSLIHLLI